MSTDTRRLNEALDHLHALLEGVFPEWEVHAADNGQVQSLNVPVLYYEATGFSTEVNGVNLPRGHVGIDITLTLAASAQDAHRELMADAMDLCLALDVLPKVHWDTAEKFVLEPGKTPAVRLSIVFLATYLPAPEPDPTPEPDPEPDAPEEEN